MQARLKRGSDTLLPPLKKQRLSSDEESKDSNTLVKQDRLTPLLEKFLLTFPKGPLQLLANLPIQEFWRFFLDGMDQENQEIWTDYEKREPGYLSAMCNAFSHMLQAVKDSKILNLTLIKELHQIALQSVKNTNYINIGKDDGYEFNNFQKYGIYLSDKKNASSQGIQEILERMNKGNTFLNLSLSGNVVNSQFLQSHDYKEHNIKNLSTNVFHDQTSVRLYSHMENISKEEYRKKLDNFVKQLIDSYKNEIKQAYTQEEKLKIIVYYIREFEQLHPYIDGNGRTFCTLLLNFLLINNGFPPVILYNPNRFDGCSLNELIDDVIQGMNNTLDLLNNKKIYQHSTVEILQPAAPEVKSTLDAAVKGIKIPNLYEQYPMMTRFQLSLKRETNAKKILEKMNNFLVLKKPWNPGLFEETKMLDEVSIPEEIKEILTLLQDESKLNHEPMAVLENIFRQGISLAKNDANRNYLRENYFKLFLPENKLAFCQAMRLDEQEYDEIIQPICSNKGLKRKNTC